MRRELAVIVAVTLVAVGVIVAMWPHEADSPTLRLSHGSGFYPDTIAVEVSFEGSGPVWFTTDGTQPDPVENPASTRQVNGPIVVADRTDQPNVYAQIPTTVEELLPFVAPSVNVPKATVLRVRAEQASEVFATYFVGPNVTDSDLAVVSLIAEPAYLFDYDTGIRVPGRLTDMWRASDEYVATPRWFDVEANFQMRGREWERPSVADVGNPVIVELCEPAVGCVVQQPVGIRTHGGASRVFSPDKSWRLYARDVYGAPQFAPEFLDDFATAHTRLILRNSGNDWDKLRFMDVFFQSLMAEMYATRQAHRSVNMFVNGEYWGVYHVRERHDEAFVAAHFGVPEGSVDLLDNSTERRSQTRRANPPEDGFVVAAPFAPHVYAAWQHIVSRPNLVSDVEKFVDVDSFFDFVITHTFAGVNDWVNNNTRWWRSVTPGTASTSHYGDGRWRFLLADFDSAMSVHDPFTSSSPSRRRITDVNVDDVMHRDGLPHLWMSLMADDLYRDRFVTRYADLLNTAFDEATTREALANMSAELARDMAMSRARWSVGPVDDWWAQIDVLDAFLAARPDQMRDELARFFSLGNPVRLSISTDASVSSLTVNTVMITPDAISDGPTFDGVYFAGVPLTVSARDLSGNVITHFDGLPDNAVKKDGKVTFIAESDVTITISETP